MKKTFCITLALIFTLALSACGKTDSPAPAVSGSDPSDTPVVAAVAHAGENVAPVNGLGFKVPQGRFCGGPHRGSPSVVEIHTFSLAWATAA